MGKLYDLARMSTATTGTGTVTLGSAVAGFLSFAASGVSDGETVTYAISDGANSEIGRGVYTASGTTLTRAAILSSTNSDAALDLSGNAQVFITAAADDFAALPNTLGAYRVKLAAGTNVTADRTLTLTTGDSDRTLDISAGSVTVSAFGATLIDDADAAAARTTLGVSAFGATLIDDADAAAAQSTLGVREVLTANRTYYVRTDGNDSNDGLTDSSGGAFLTIGAAVAAAQNNIDAAGYDVTISVGNGTYTSSVLLGTVIGAGSTVTLKGGSGTASDVTISTSSYCVSTQNTPTTWSIEDMTLTSSGSHCLYVTRAYCLFDNVAFGTAGGNHVSLSALGRVRANGNYSITGGATHHFYLDEQSTCLSYNITATLTGTPAFSSYFVGTNQTSLANFPSMTYSGSATGARYRAASYSVIDSGGGGASYFPGDSAGFTTTGGAYL